MNATSPLTTRVVSTKKPRMLVVDDEPDNLDLLYRTFRREYQVLRAESGVHALEILQSEGEVAVIISDQRMPEMTGTEFLSKTVPEFPDTVRIILTGFTDVEDLVQAINDGQVYRYITKPWDPDELKAVVQRAAETYELLKQRTEELQIAEKQTRLLTAVGQLAAQPMSQSEVLQMLAQELSQQLAAQVCVLTLEQAAETAGMDAATIALVRANPLVKSAIAERLPQACADTERDAALATERLYSTTATRSHLVVPVLYQGAIEAVFSLQWPDAYTSLEDASKLLHLVAAQSALGLRALST